MLENLEDQRLQSAFMSSKIMQQTPLNSFLHIESLFSWEDFHNRISRYPCEGRRIPS